MDPLEWHAPCACDDHWSQAERIGSDCRAHIIVRANQAMRWTPLQQVGHPQHQLPVPKRCGQVGLLVQIRCLTRTSLNGLVA